ncbi:POP1-domain-containing protein [Ramaria rubella]|nr:POP1-domain-containing protein [Ramaria rubella]
MIGLPSAIDVEKFTEARSFEIAAMQSAMESAQGSSTQRAWQALPRALRRRAASHDVRRVPVRLREKARAEMDPAKRKALGRKPPKRGKAKQVTRTQSFLKRQRDKTWLETHLWHAKRMHMKNVWGYRLSETPTEKSYRPSHRSAIRASIIHDTSYMCTISISGKQFLLEKMLANCCDCQGAGPGAIRYTLGSRIHETHLYKPGAYPCSLIAPITIMWKSLAPVSVPVPPDPEGSSTNANQAATSKPKKRRRGKGKSTEDVAPQASAKPDSHAFRTLWIRVHPSAWPEVWHAVREAASEDKNKSKGPEPEESIHLVDLRSQVNSFELMGPRSSQVFSGAMTLVNGDVRPIFKQFWDQFKVLHSPGSVPRGMVVGLKVHDPRLNFPPKNAKALYKTDGELPRISLPAAFSVFPNAVLARGDLWEAVEHDGGARKPKFEQRDLDDRRQKNLIPGTALQPLRQDDRVPVVLIQRTAAPISSSPTPMKSDATDGNTIHGWTILLPPHWSMAFFSTLIHTGTRIGGLRERRTQVFEAGSPDFPFDYPLTPAYDREEVISERVERERWERKPPAKRVGWDSVGTRSPWRADWEVVLGFPPRQIQKQVQEDGGLMDVQRESLDDTSRTANRDKDDRAKETKWLLRGPDTPGIIEAASTALHPAATLLDMINAQRAKRALGSLQMEGRELLNGALVPVKLNICGRGAPDDLAAIYEVGPNEGRQIRQMLAKKKGGDVEGDVDDEASLFSKLAVGDSEIIGYVTTGKYSLSRGKGHAIGAVSARRLITMVTTDKK